MLSVLRISNFAVIEEVEIGFSGGLTVLTGETGAGKSILVDALGLLMGGRADPEVIRAGADEATVEAVLEPTSLLTGRLERLGLPTDDAVSVRRVIQRSGRGKVYVNGALVTVGVLATLMRGGIDVAGQHEHVRLFDGSVQRELLDGFDEVSEPLRSYRVAWDALSQLDRKLELLGGDEQMHLQRLELLRFQLEELDKVEPRPGEELALEEERRRLGGIERLRRAAGEANALLGGEDDGPTVQLGRALRAVQEAVRIDASLGGVERPLMTALTEVEEAARTLARYLDGLEADPRRLTEVEDRLDQLKRLARKHGVSLDALPERRSALAAECERLENRTAHVEALGAERASAVARAETLAAALTRAREEAAGKLAGVVQDGLASLALGRATFAVRLSPLPALRQDGKDAVEFLFGANPGEAARPLAKVASGGEASRLLLALKRGLSGQDACGCYVLDEADAGVSGAVADVVGQMIRSIARDRQVLCITHLPQVAAYADAHLRIQKRQVGARTVSQVLSLGRAEDRTQELARMLSGIKVTREAIGAAKALVRSARSNRGRGRLKAA
jgi:DNA repair protein RecN (Recombination protein N)